MNITSLEAAAKRCPTQAGHVWRLPHPHLPGTHLACKHPLHACRPNPWPPFAFSAVVQVTFGDFPAFICLASLLLEYAIGNAVVARGFSTYLVSGGCPARTEAVMSTVPVGPHARLWVLLLAPQALHSSLGLPPLSGCCASADGSRSVLCASLHHCLQARLLNLEPGYFRVGDNGPCGNAQGGKYDVMAAGECGRASGGVHLAGEGDLRML